MWLPKYIINYICAFLDVADACRFSNVSKYIKSRIDWHYYSRARCGTNVYPINAKTRGGVILSNTITFYPYEVLDLSHVFCLAVIIKYNSHIRKIILSDVINLVVVTNCPNLETIQHDNAAVICVDTCQKAKVALCQKPAGYLAGCCARILQQYIKDVYAKYVPSYIHVNTFMWHRGINCNKFAINYKCIKYLSLINCGIVSIDHFNNMPNVEYVNLSHNKIEHIRRKIKMPKLRCYDLSYNPLASMKSISVYQKLTELMLLGTYMDYIPGIEHIRGPLELYVTSLSMVVPSNVWVFYL